MKLKEFNVRLDGWMLGNLGLKYECVMSDGNSGGFLSCWNEIFFKVESKQVVNRFILLFEMLIGEKLRCSKGNIYAPNNDEDNRVF